MSEQQGERTFHQDLKTMGWWRAYKFDLVVAFFAGGFSLFVVYGLVTTYVVKATDSTSSKLQVCENLRHPCESRLLATTLQSERNAEERQQAVALVEKCRASLKEAPKLIEQKQAELEANQKEVDTVGYASAYRISTRGHAFPELPDNQRFESLFPEPFDTYWGPGWETKGDWFFDAANCSLNFQGTNVYTSEKNDHFHLRGLLSIAVEDLDLIAAAQAPAEGEEADLYWQMKEDPFLAFSYFLDGSFIDWQTQLYSGSEQFFGRHLLKLAAPVASDPVLVDKLADWFVKLVREHKPFKGQAGGLVKRYLALMWDASWAHMRKIDELVAQEHDLYSAGPVCRGADGGCPPAYDMTNWLEGWWYRRWKAAGGGENGDALIAKYRAHMIAIGKEFGMPSFVEKWEGQVKTGNGPPWPKPKE